MQVTRDTLPPMAMKDMHLQQLLQNLIGNAPKYRKDDERPCIRVLARLADCSWEFAVADNGIGIASEFHDKVFGIFKRLHGKEGNIGRPASA